MTTAPVAVLLAQIVDEAPDRQVSGTDIAVIATVVVVAFIATRLLRPILRFLLTWLARRSLAGSSVRWQVRSPRVFGETAEQAELRRRQRIAAASTGLSRVASMAVWLIVILLILQRVDVDPVYAVSAAGFIGVALSIGGQHAVNDFLSGLHILLEDRFGEGDQLEIKVNDEVQVGRVVSLGAFSTRLEGSHATYHLPNREIALVVNLSQRGATTELAVAREALPDGSRTRVETALRLVYRQAPGFDRSRDGLILDEINSDDDGYVVTVRTARPLSQPQKRAILDSLEDKDDGSTA